MPAAAAQSYVIYKANSQDENVLSPIMVDYLSPMDFQKKAEVD